jgi:hypothetical protein
MAASALEECLTSASIANGTSGWVEIAWTEA